MNGYVEHLRQVDYWSVGFTPDFTDTYEKADAAD